MRVRKNINTNLRYLIFSELKPETHIFFLGAAYVMTQESLYLKWEREQGILCQAAVVRPSTFSKDISSEAMKPILTIFHIL